MAEFELYCDDSGTDGNSTIAVAACYISPKRQWDEFVRNWDDVRQAEGFDAFHMAEFVAKPDAGHKPFCDWDNTKKDRVYAKLSSIINTRARQGFGVAIPKAAYDNAAPRSFRDRYADDHFTYAVLCCFSLVKQWHSSIVSTHRFSMCSTKVHRRHKLRKCGMSLHHIHQKPTITG